MNTIAFPFSLPGCAVDQVQVTEKLLTIEAHTLATEAQCPYCGEWSQRIHSYYTRHPYDLPLGSYTVRLCLRVRRFRCRNANCAHTTFTEPLPEILPKLARRTQRLRQSLRQIALALGGEAGARLAAQLHFPASGDTLLRIIRQPVFPEQSLPRIIGIDDWAWRKGHRYGTIVVDLERHTPIDLLPDREAATVAAWLKEHPQLQVVSRDRSPEYAHAITEGAPQAIQVADRWHLLCNWREALERLLDRLHASLCNAPLPTPLPLPEGIELDIGQEAIRPYRRAPSEEVTRQIRRAQRQKRYEQVVALHQQGWQIRELARHFGMSRVTIRRYIQAGAFPERTRRRARPSLLDPYVPYLQQRWDAGRRNVQQLWREIKEQGFKGSSKLIYQWRRAQEANASQTSTPIPITAASDATPSDPQTPPTMPLSTPMLPGARRLVWLLLRPASTLTPYESFVLQVIRQNAEVEQAYLFTQRFLQMVRNRQAEALQPWLTDCIDQGSPELKTFAMALQREYASIAAALSLSWSSGQVEGQINRLKMLKRQMYGRASFELLRQRVLHTV